MVDKSEKVVWGARLGYMIRGLVYALFGYLALTSGHRDEASAGTQGSLEFIKSIPGGTVILYVCAVGLLGYAVYKLIAAVLDTERAGDDLEGYARRAGWVVSFVIYSTLAWTAFKLANGMQQDTGGTTQSVVQTVFSYSLGSVVIGLAGVAMLVGAGDQLRRAWTTSFMKHISSNAPRLTCYIGRVGHVARGVVLGLVGWSLVKSAWFSQSEQVRSLGEALLDLQSMGIAFNLVAIGLIFFGVFSMITARYRIIPDPDPTPGR